MDDDKLTRCRVTCRAKIHLREMKNLSSAEDVPVELNLEPVVYDQGQLLIALSYLPTSQRLSASVMKANKLAWSNLVNDVTEFRKLCFSRWVFQGCFPGPCVKVVLLDHGGKILKKKKIWGDSGVESPSFNGSICFQISAIDYETATIIFVISSEVCKKYWYWLTQFVLNRKKRTHKHWKKQRKAISWATQLWDGSSKKNRAAIIGALSSKPPGK